MMRGVMASTGGSGVGSPRTSVGDGVLDVLYEPVSLAPGQEQLTRMSALDAETRLLREQQRPTQTTLNVHKRMHTGERLLQCLPEDRSLLINSKMKTIGLPSS